MKIITVIISIGFGLLIAGCSTLPNEKSPHPKFSYSKYKHELSLINKDSFNLGLSLSGGGLRASLFSYGALKALYDKDILKDVDVISSVSGGGYTAYALYTSNNRDGFGSSLFSNSSFYEETCKLVTTGNFVTTMQMIDAGVSLNPKKEAINLYHRSIGRTFGKNDQNIPLRNISDLTTEIESNKVPFLIINATVEEPKPTGWDDGLFEFTPLWTGNDSYNYHHWNNGGDFEFRRAVAISGAAFAPLLKQTITTNLPNQISNTAILSDGGKSENLGAIALVKRGVKNIIIVDAEHDPKYEFGAYKNLKNRLKAFNSDVKIASIDNAIISGNRLKSGVHIGTIVTQFAEEEKISNIYYIKMAMPKSLDAVLLDKKSLAHGKEYHNKYFETLEEGKDENDNWNCSDVRDIEININDWYAYNIASYSGFLNNNSYVKEADKFPGEFLTANFPQYTTLDQSFYLDQALAFIGLGYIEMSNAIDVIKKPNK